MRLLKMKMIPGNSRANIWPGIVLFVFMFILVAIIALWVTGGIDAATAWMQGVAQGG